MISTVDAAALVAAGTAAGTVGSAGGITSMVSYPALLAVGLSPVSASIANSVAIPACWPGSALASQVELRGRSAWLWHWGTVAAFGGAAGAALLLLTPARVFEDIVPFLVLAGSAGLIAEPRLRRRRAQHATSPVLPAGVLVLSLYNGYFGAGAGMMLLTLMLVFVDRDLPAANALKNMLLGAASVVSATLFAVSGSVTWSAALPLAVGMLIGSNLGPRVTRHVSPTLMRRLIAALGFALAIQLALDAYL
jgi:uncharacterized protein